MKPITQSGDSIRVVHPLFQKEGDGSIPISPLQLRISKVHSRKAMILNKLWHSRLPEIRNYHNCSLCFSAEYDNRYYAIAMWSNPSNRFLNGRNWLELRRMAISPDAPKNTASFMIKIMKNTIKKENLKIIKLISYQDEDVHIGTIYKASGWYIGTRSKFHTWEGRPGRKDQSNAPKTRWEFDLPYRYKPRKQRNQKSIPLIKEIEPFFK